MVFGAAARDWLRYIEFDRKRRVSTVREYQQVVHAHLIPEFGEDTPLCELTTARIEKYRERLVAEERLSARTINRNLTRLNGIFRRAIRAHGLRDNPAAHVDRQPIRASGDFRVFTPRELERLFNAALSDQDRAMFAVAAYAGLRMGELRALTWGDIEFDRQVLHVRRSYVLGKLELPKSGRVRSVPLIPQAAMPLSALRRRAVLTAAGDRVFLRGDGGFIDDSAVRRRFHQAVAAAGLPRLRFHDLRHSFGTIAVQAFPLSDVAAYMGHADISTTMIYVH
ncbi:MAG: site-specific integrase, partial [Actinobacteria bacterium]|nr:site-specific integrase [Actinomycetota bacterium]